MPTRRLWKRRSIVALALAAPLLAACGAALAPTATIIPPTATPVPPTPTPLPPTPTPAPSATPVPPTATAAPLKPAAATAAPSVAATVPAAQPAGGSLPPEIQRAVVAYAGLKSFRGKGVLTTKATGTKMDVQMDYLAPDRLAIRTTGGATAQPTDIVVIGESVYVKTGDAWLKLEGDAGRQTSATLLKAIDLRSLLEQASKATFKPAGNETVDGEPCVAFSYVNDLGATGKLWISTRDSVPRRWETKTEAVEVGMTIGEINQPLKIDPPV